MTFCQTYRALRCSIRRDGADFSNGDVPFTQKDGLPLGKPLEVAGEMGFRFMDIKPNHRLLLN